MREALDANPEGAVVRGKWSAPEFLKDVSLLNPKLKDTQFTDYHGHGWNFRAVYKRDRKGNLLDARGAVVPQEDPDKFQKAVHLKSKNATCMALPTNQNININQNEGELILKTNQEQKMHEIYRYAFITDIAPLADGEPRNNFFRRALTWNPEGALAAGADGLMIADVENPEKPKLYMQYNADGQINDARDVTVGSTNASLIAWRITSSPAAAISKGLDHDRAVDETGGRQVGAFFFRCMMCNIPHSLAVCLKQMNFS